MTAKKRIIVGHISGAIFLSQELNKKILRMSEALTQEPVVRASGFHRPFIPFWKVYSPQGIPEQFLDLFMDEFENTCFKPLEMSSDLGMMEDGMICAVFKQHKMINMVKDEINHVFSKFCEEITTMDTWEDVWAPVIFLGYGCKKTPPFLMELPDKDMLPQRLVVGQFTKNYGFKAVMKSRNKGR
ncbi:MAG: hypothetical protein NUV49_03105 [Patescibacteria group bacterium]|nr:hypothetical protein [Patescibacteria group bacterium]